MFIGLIFLIAFCTGLSGAMIGDLEVAFVGLIIAIVSGIAGIDS
jgi:hypothetical protein